MGYLKLLHGLQANCPVNWCNKRLVPKELLTHMLMHHRPADALRELHADQSTIFVLNVDDLLPGRNYAIAAIAYAGPVNKELDQSRALSTELQVLHHLPLLLMLFVYHTEFADDKDKQFLFYVVSGMHTTRATMQITLFDAYQMNERKGLRCLNNMLYPSLDNEESELSCGHDYLIYTVGDIKKLRGPSKMRKLFVKLIVRGQSDMFGDDLCYELRQHRLQDHDDHHPNHPHHPHHHHLKDNADVDADEKKVAEWIELNNEQPLSTMSTDVSHTEST